MHEIVGFAGATTTLLRLRKPWPHARIYRLSRGMDLAFLPIPDWNTVEQEEAAGRKVPDNYLLESDFSPPYVERFAVYSMGSALAWLRTYYYMGLGYQVAILWIDGVPIFGPDHAESGMCAFAERPINRALRGIGVKAIVQCDEFMMFGLAGYRTYQHIVNDAEELVPPE
jgi:hypothetical protein